MKTYILGFVLLGLLVGSGVHALVSSVSSPTCTLTVSPTPIELLKTTPLNIVWTSTGGSSATLKINAWSQPNIYSTTGLNGNITIPVQASMGLEATVTVTRNSPFGTSVCKTQIPTFWTPKL